jgi:hypothetical protein
MLKRFPNGRSVRRRLGFLLASFEARTSFAADWHHERRCNRQGVSLTLSALWRAAAWRALFLGPPDALPVSMPLSGSSLRSQSEVHDVVQQRHALAQNFRSPVCVTFVRAEACGTARGVLDFFGTGIDTKNRTMTNGQ